MHDILDTHGMPQSTRHTITDREVLFEKLEEIRERGIAYCGQERVEGLQCVATPILSTDDRVLGAISVAGPTTRIEGERFRTEIPELVMQAANVIEINVTYA